MLFNYVAVRLPERTGPGRDVFFCLCLQGKGNAVDEKASSGNCAKQIKGKLKEGVDAAKVRGSKYWVHVLPAGCAGEACCPRQKLPVVVDGLAGRGAATAP